MFHLLKAQLAGYNVTLLYFWLSSSQMAFDRVAKRVSRGGHNIPLDIIERRYFRGIKNLINLYIPICNNWLVFTNVNVDSKLVAKKSAVFGKVVLNDDIWNIILKQNDIYK